MTLNDRLRWASVFGVCYVLGAVGEWTFFNWLHVIHPTSQGHMYFNFFVWGFILVVVDSLFILMVLGYRYIGQKS